MYDVRPEQYPTVIREMIRHENDVTNHRIMWLLVGQGFIANAYVSVKGNEGGATVLSLLGIFVALSAFVMLYRSYQARGYLQFLGEQAKQGTLKEEHLPLTGYPRNRINDWWRDDWVCSWIRQTRDLFEPWLLMPYLFTNLWITGLIRARGKLNVVVISLLGVILSAVILFTSCVVLVWSQGKDDKGTAAP